MTVMQGYNLFIKNALKYGFSLFGLPKTNSHWGKRTGDDGYYKKGYPLSGPRFTDNGDGTLIDNATGLMWVADPSQLGGAFGTPGSPATMDWNACIDNCNALVYAGYDDWRLPNFLELNSIVNYNIGYPAVYPEFKNINETAVFFSSTTYIDFPPAAFGLDVSAGFANFYMKIELFYPLPCRGGA